MWILDQRTHDVGLAAGLQLPAQPLIRVRSLLRPGHQTRLDGRAAARKLPQRAHVEVAVAAERERPRDRCGRHVQNVRRARLLLFQRRPLAHAEAVLLIDDRDRQRPEAHVGLDQRVRADHERQLAA